MAFPLSQRAARGYGPLYAQIEGINLNRILTKAIHDGIRIADDVANEQRHAFFTAFNQYRSGKGGSRSLASANKELAYRAQLAVIASYDERVEGRKKHPSYRIGQNRYAGGALRRALADPDMFVGTYQGISFVNVPILDREAKHWARLNWGAGGAAGNGQYQPTRAFFKLFGQFLGSLTPPSHPQAAFKTPPGVYVGGYGKFEGAKWGDRSPGFYPTRRSPLRYKTKGIEQRRFFDAAYVAIGAGMNEVYGDLLTEWVDQAMKTRPKGLAGRAVINGLVNWSLFG